MFKELAGLGSMLKQASQMQGRMAEMAESLKSKRTTGSAGGGMVEIEVNGAMEVLGCRIDEQLFQNPDREMIEDLLVTAMNQAIAKGKGLHAEALQDLTGGMNLPGLQEALGQMGVGSPGEDADGDQG